ncbi:MAG: hypothetical protein EP319_10130 [Deltaproteobacteria bacterium]|nr:MAG: hypothetical protein EP319_10130 [Deltaproteobacteria bacterium]
MNKTLKNIYTICLVASLAASFAYLRDVNKKDSKPFIFVSHFTKKSSKAPVEAVSEALVKVKKKAKTIAKQSKKNLVKKVSFAKPINKKITIKEVVIANPELEVKGPRAAQVVTGNDQPLNNSELINHYGYKVEIKNLEKLSWAEYFQSQNIDRKLASLNEGEGPTLQKAQEIEDKRLAEIEEENKKITEAKIEDFVKTVASQKVSTQEETDLVFYDYSKTDNEEEANVDLVNEVKIEENKIENKEVNKEIVTEVIKTEPAAVETVAEANQENNNEGQSAIISKNVLAAIEREMADTPKFAQAASKVSTHNSPVSDYSKVVDEIHKKRSAAKKMNTQTSGYSKTIITSYEVTLGEESGDPLRSFQISAASEGNERIDDNNNGFVNIETNLASGQGVYRATILKRDFLRTTMDIALEPGTIEVAVPTISQESMMKFLEAQGVNGLGGFLLIDRDRGVESLDIDAEFEAKYDLDENFKVTKDEKSMRYVFFAGVSAGNTLLKVRTVENEYSEKIIHIVEDEVLFEALLIAAPETMKVTTMERTILSNRSVELDIDAENIKYFNRDIKANKLASNLHEIKVPVLPLGMRKYLAFSHMKETVYVGIGDNSEVELPSSDFIVNLLEANSMSGMEGKCVIQVNLRKELLSVKANGESARGPMALDKFYLEKNGSLSEEETPLSTKVFILGDHQGIVNLKIEYQDKQTDYLQTFCSPETYLLEQL